MNCHIQNDLKHYCIIAHLLLDVSIVKWNFIARIKGLRQLKSLESQIIQMKQLASQLKKDKDGALKKVSELEKEISGSRAKLQVMTNHPKNQNYFLHFIAFQVEAHFIQHLLFVTNF